jgi:ATP-dependent RNA helicase DDX19/DBP5
MLRTNTHSLPSVDDEEWNDVLPTSTETVMNSTKPIATADTGLSTSKPTEFDFDDLDDCIVVASKPTNETLKASGSSKAFDSSKESESFTTLGSFKAPEAASEDDFHEIYKEEIKTEVLKDEDGLALHDKWEDLIDYIPTWLMQAIIMKGLDNPIGLQQATATIVTGYDRNFFIQSPTGTGKTLGFVIPSLSMIDENTPAPQLVIVAPTKDLVDQIYGVIADLLTSIDVNIAVAKHVGISTKNPIDGTHHIDKQANSYESTIFYKRSKPSTSKISPKKISPGQEQVIVGTSGRIRALFDRSKPLRAQNSGRSYMLTVDAKYVSQCIFDECDTLLPKMVLSSNSMSDDIEYLMGQFDFRSSERSKTGIFPQACRYLLVSATTDEDMIRVAGILDAVPIILQNNEQKSAISDRITHRYISYHSEDDKIPLIIDILRACNMGGSKIIFAESKAVVEKIYTTLLKGKYAVSWCHGVLPANERLRNVENFRRGNTNIMVSTNALARGIDITQVQMVIHFDVPEQATYQHRSGRGGRGNLIGLSILFVRQDHDHSSKPQEVRDLERSCAIHFEELSANFFNTFNFNGRA